MNTSGVKYWLASRCVVSDSDYSIFGARLVLNGNVTWKMLAQGTSSNCWSEWDFGGVYPVVYLKSSIQTSGKDPSGAWTIIDK